MKIIFLFTILCMLTLPCFSQIQVTKIDGGSTVTKLGFGIQVNEGSTLKREYVILNDTGCPIELNGSGIQATYADRSYLFLPVGKLQSKEPITAFEINYILYNVFGEHIKTLSTKEVTDINGVIDLSKIATWHATENQISEYLYCVAYVAKVRTKEGKIWSSNQKEIKEELYKLAIRFDESYAPQKEKNDK